MKKIQKILLMVITLLMAGLQTSCTDYQDEIDALDVRVTVLENLVKQLNLDLSSMRTIVEVIENGDYITNVTENAEGYIITFGKHGAIVIKNGIDGKNGKDAEAPNISVAKDLGFGGVVICGDLWNRFNIHSETDYKELIAHFEKLRKAVG